MIVRLIAWLVHSFSCNRFVICYSVSDVYLSVLLQMSNLQQYVKAKVYGNKESVKYHIF